MINLLAYRLNLHLFSVFPYLSALMGMIISIIFFYFYFYSKNKFFLNLFYFILFINFYNFCVGNLFYIKNKADAVLSYNLYFISIILMIIMFIVVVYRILDRDRDIISYIIFIFACLISIIILRSGLIKEIIIKDAFYRFKPTLFYFIFMPGIYLIIAFGSFLLSKNITLIHNNINIPLFSRSFLFFSVFVAILSFSDVLNVLGVVSIPPLFAVGTIVYMLALLFDVAKNQVVYYTILKKSYLQTIVGLADLIDSRDRHTYRHSYRVSQYALFLAEKLNFTKEKINQIETAALLHDIGKIGISDKVLLKKSKLNDDEWHEMKKHPEKGESILKLVSFLEDESKMIRLHHERLDGAGYPYGLQEDVTIEVEVLSLSDSFDAMTSDRPYRRPKSLKEVFAEIKKMRGKKFSNRVIDVMINNWDELAVLFKKLEKEK